jgi:hypothetical protein
MLLFAMNRVVHSELLYDLRMRRLDVQLNSVFVPFQEQKSLVDSNTLFWNDSNCVILLRVVELQDSA